MKIGGAPGPTIVTMTIKQTIPYLNFAGNGAEAIELYASALGARVSELMHFSDMEGQPFGAESEDRILHAHLTIGEAAIMISDLPPGREAMYGNAVNISLQLDDEAQFEKCFDALAEGGKVMMEPHDTFWKARFGTLVDRFGIHWMFNCPK